MMASAITTAANTPGVAGSSSNSTSDNPTLKKGGKSESKVVQQKIQVALRMRPLSTTTREQSSTTAATTTSSSHGRVWQVNTQENTITQTNIDGVHEPGHDVYAYAHTFGEDSTNRNVYDSVGKSIVSDVLQGYHGTIFTYGQTASGKTFTMQGCEGNAGILQMAASDVFSHINNISKDKDAGKEYLVKVSFIEIYNEVVRDLLAMGDGNEVTLKVREDKRIGFFVSSHEMVVSSMDDLLNAVFEGEKNRSVGSTKMNERSSRSHTIFRITVECRLNDEGMIASTLNLVDLAGSESARHTKAAGDRQKEGAKINQSNLALSLVIKGLGQNATGKKKVHIDYRSSNLTKLLQPSLSGNAKMSIICCATPSEMYLEETRSTLQFAERAEIVKIEAKKIRRRLTDIGHHHHHGRRSSIIETPRKKMAKMKQFLSPAGFLSPAKPASAITKRYPQTDVKSIRAKRTSTLFSSIPEDDENSALQRDLAKKDAKIASLEANLRATTDELQSAKTKFQRQQAEIEWLRSANQDLQSSVSTLIADKDFLQMEKQMDGNPADEDNRSFGGESNDSDVTIEYTGRMDPSSGDSHDGVVVELERSKTKICELETPAVDQHQQTVTNDENKAPYKSMEEEYLTPTKAATSSNKQSTSKKRTPFGKATFHNIKTSGRKKQARDRKKPSRYSPSKAVSGRMSSKPSMPESTAEFGAVGYKFRKHFDWWGTYDGVVVEILPNGERRVDYPADTSLQGEEILSLDDLPRPKPRKSSKLEMHVHHSKKKEMQKVDKKMDDLTIYHEEVLKRAKARSQAAVAEMMNKGEEAMWLKNAACHICHGKKQPCVTFHCSKHKYCLRHCRERLGFSPSDYDSLKPSNLTIDYCPVCSLSCKCTKCMRQLDDDARDLNRRCQEQSCEPAYVEMNVFG